VKVDKTLFYLTTFLLTLSVIFVYSMSIYKTTHSNLGEFHFLIRQFIAVFLGITIMWYLSTLNPDKYFKPIGMTLFILFIFLMSIMHFFPQEYVMAINGAKRWIKIPSLGVSLAPVEFFKIGFIYFLAWSFSRKIELAHKISLQDDIKRFTPYLILFLIVVYLVAIMQNDFGQVMVMGFVLLVMGLMAGISSRLFLAVSLLGITLLSYLIMHNENRFHRIQEWFYDFQSLFLKILPKSLQSDTPLSNSKTQLSYSYDAIINGGSFGTGIGNGVIKLGFLPEVHTDFILAGIAEEIGTIGVSFIIIIFFIIIFRILKIANRLTNRMYSNFAFGSGLLIAVSLFLNAFGITGAIPIKGIAVPFLSYGGSSIVAVSIMMGMILMISKRAK
jgi:cell division protein FtsW